MTTQSSKKTSKPRESRYKGQWDTLMEANRDWFKRVDALLAEIDLEKDNED